MSRVPPGRLPPDSTTSCAVWTGTEHRSHGVKADTGAGAGWARGGSRQSEVQPGPPRRWPTGPVMPSGQQRTMSQGGCFALELRWGVKQEEQRLLLALDLQPQEFGFCLGYSHGQPRSAQSFPFAASAKPLLTSVARWSSGESFSPLRVKPDALPGYAARLLRVAAAASLVVRAVLLRGSSWVVWSWPLRSGRPPRPPSALHGCDGARSYRRASRSSPPALRLAPPSSTLSPGSVENNSNASNILLSGSGAAKRGKALGNKAEPELAEAPPAHLGKLQPLVASYLCSDVTSVPSTKESLKLQGVLIKQAVLKTHGVLPDSYFNSGDFLPRKAPGEQLKAAMSGGQPAAPPTPRPPSTAWPGSWPSPARTGTAPPGRSPRTRPANPPTGGSSPSPWRPPWSLGAGRAVLRPPARRWTRPALSPLPAWTRRCGSAPRRAGRGSARWRAVCFGCASGCRWCRPSRWSGTCSSSCAACCSRPCARPRPAGSFLRGGSVPGELDRLALSGTAGLRAVEAAFDSDATESSSGGESDVEEDQLAQADLERRHVSLWRRAEGRFALERASIISHWNWLQAHISDLEYRIRQETDIYRQLRSNKGLIVLGDSAPCEVSLEDGTEVKAEPITCHVTQERVVGGAECADADSGLWKGWAPGRPVNGVLNSLLPSLPVTGSPESSDTEEQLSKKQRGLHPCSSSSSSSSAQDASCVAARTRPVLSCKKRRLVRPNAVSNLNRKAQRTPGPRCGCDVSPSCLMCGGRGALTGDLQYERPLLDRLSQSDPCVHPILSFDDDVSMMLHLQGALKTHWQNRPLEKFKPLKKLSLKHKLSGRLSDPSSPCSSSSKDKHKLSNSLIATVTVRSRGHSRKRPRDRSLDRTDPSSKLFPDTCSPCSSNSLHTPTHSPLLRQLSTSSESSAPFALNSQSAISTRTCVSGDGLYFLFPSHQPIRRRRGESSFDINNIVIPMSVAATTRVEKLQYKEILASPRTPLEVTPPGLAPSAPL
ncbi:hypothetical protein ANANG_G00296720 [Anguilla anguilla]|uniref:PEHE domain-containing protein n=1 Tax=Anguilla anguilla TaxID=7936 RepID=A0A9D3LLX5_ANGAN|nr:hypothetical protein ANANG_G00296720 [Anguilla anguilla]